MTREPILIEHDRTGILLPEAGVWLDAHTGKDVCVMTHAHSDHVARHRLTITSHGTAAIYRARYGGRNELLPLEWGEFWEHGGFRFLLTPAGHILGSAMVHATRLTDGATLLYTGDFKLRPSLSCEPAKPLPADTLLMECTFGEPRWVFPECAEARAQVRAWCRAVLQRGATPALLAYSLGKAQEAQMVLAGEFPTAVHPSVAEMNRCYEALGVRLPPWEEATPVSTGCVLIVPPTGMKNFRRREDITTALISGWALNSSARYQFKTDAAFPLSDHADWPDLLRLVELVAPRRILTTHGPAADFAAQLRRHGHDAWSLHGGDQAELDLR